MLLFKKKFLDLIRSGQKTQTIRLWKFRKFKAGQRSYIPTIGYIQITTVEAVSLEALDDEDARLDGFPSAERLVQEIEQLYPAELAAGYQAFRVGFSVLDEAQQSEIREQRALAKAAARAKPPK